MFVQAVRVPQSESFYSVLKYTADFFSFKKAGPLVAESWDEASVAQPIKGCSHSLVVHPTGSCKICKPEFCLLSALLWWISKLNRRGSLLFFFFSFYKFWVTLFRVLEVKADNSNYLFLGEFFGVTSIPTIVLGLSSNYKISEYAFSTFLAVNSVFRHLLSWVQWIYGFGNNGYYHPRNWVLDLKVINNVDSWDF